MNLSNWRQCAHIPSSCLQKFSPHPFIFWKALILSILSALNSLSPLPLFAQGWWMDERREWDAAQKAPCPAAGLGPSGSRGTDWSGGLAGRATCCPSARLLPSLAGQQGHFTSCLPGFIPQMLLTAPNSPSWGVTPVWVRWSGSCSSLVMAVWTRSEGSRVLSCLMCEMKWESSGVCTEKWHLGVFKWSRVHEFMMIWKLFKHCLSRYNSLKWASGLVANAPIWESFLGFFPVPTYSCRAPACKEHPRKRRYTKSSQKL